MTECSSECAIVSRYVAQAIWRRRDWPRAAIAGTGMTMIEVRSQVSIGLL